MDANKARELIKQHKSNSERLRVSKDIYILR